MDLFHWIYFVNLQCLLEIEKVQLYFLYLENQNNLVSNFLLFDINQMLKNNDKEF